MKTCLSNLMSVALTILELLAFSAPKIGGHMTLATPPFLKMFKGSRLDRTYKHVCQTALDLLAFNAQKFRGHVTLAMPPFKKFLIVGDPEGVTVHPPGLNKTNFFIIL